MVRVLWTSAGLFFVALGLAGVFLPVMPTTPFLLLASACFVRSSPRMHRWLLESKLLGPFLRDWDRYHGVRLHVKVFAICMILSAVGLSLHLGLPNVWALAALIVLAASGLIVVLRLKVIRE